MKEEFLIFQKFNSEKSAVDFGKLMEKNKIDYLIENISIKFDPILSNNEFGKELCVKLQKSNFEIADKILSETSKIEIEKIEKDYYLLSFSDEELKDVIYKSDEWNKFDVELAHKLLKERGIELTTEQIKNIKKDRIIALSQPEESQKIYIIVGYVFALLGGFLGIFIGWHLLTYKKTIPDGNQIYAYSENDRKQGNRILIIGSIFTVIWILFRIFNEVHIRDF
ncbi:MAG: hypothetical protein H7250_07185 [Flavobacterium sp.]|nr:hypothetical protein [Flavobacterium sp.]